MLKFGITERGDIAFSDNWIKPVKDGYVLAAILISKGMPTIRGQEAMIDMKDRLIFHATTTGFGGTILEPNVVPAAERLEQLKTFCNKGFPMTHIVIRVDPMIPTSKGIARAESVIKLAYELGFRRFRYSWLDCYAHVKTRFLKTGLPVPPSITEANTELVSSFVNEFCSEYEAKGCIFESCAEINRHQTGCISARDFKLCGLDPKEALGKSSQRKQCRCCAAKTELLSTKGRCPHNCLYCYWR